MNQCGKFLAAVFFSATWIYSALSAPVEVWVGGDDFLVGFDWKGAQVFRTGDTQKAPKAVRGMTIGPDGGIYVCVLGLDKITHYDREGQFLGDFCTEVASPQSCRFGPDGNLYVAELKTHTIIKIDNSTREVKGVFADVNAATGNPAGGAQPMDLAFGPDRKLYVSAHATSQVLRFDGRTGAFETAVLTERDGLDGPQGMVFGSDGGLYVTSSGTNQVLRFDLSTETTRVFAASPMKARNNVQWPVFGPDGHLYVAMDLGLQVVRFHGETGEFMDVFARFEFADRPRAVLAVARKPLVVHTVDGVKIQGAIRGIHDGHLVIVPQSRDALLDLPDRTIALIDVEVIDFPGQGSPDPKDPPQHWRVLLTGGDRLPGELIGWSEDGVELQLDLGNGPGEGVTIDASHLRALWHMVGDRFDADREMGAKPGDRDVLYAMSKNGKIQAVEGSLRGFHERRLSFEYNGQVRQVGLERVVGIVFAAPKQAAATTRFHQVFALRSGDRVSGQLVAVDEDGALKITTPWGGLLSLPRSTIAKMKTANGRLIHLTELEPIRVEETPYFDRMLSYRVDRSLTGGPLRLQDGKHARGIAVHSRTILDYDLGGRWESFRAKVGFQQPEGRRGRCAIRVLGDGKVLFDIEDACGDQDPIPVDLKITGVKILSLSVDFGEDQDVADRVVWAEPRLVRGAVESLGD